MNTILKLLLISTLLGPIASAQQPLWQAAGLTGVTDVKPSSSGWFYAWCSPSLYRSSDAGQTWVRLPISPVQAFAQLGNGLLFVSSPGSTVKRSSEQGETWVLVTNLGSFTESVPRFLSFDDPYFLVLQRYDSGSHGSTVPSDLYLSSDFGDSWHIGTLPPISNNPPVAPTIISVAHWVDRVVFAAAASQVFFSADTDRNFTALTGVPSATISSLFTSPELPAVYLITNGGMFASSDTGKSWMQRNIGLSNTNVLSFKMTTSGEFLAGTEGGIFSSKDYGSSWTSLGLAQLHVTSIAVYDPLTLLVTTDKGIFFSADHGKSWNSLNDGLPSMTVAFLTLGTDGYALAVSGGMLYRTRDVVSHFSAFLQQPALPGYFGLDIGNTWVYGASSSYEGKDQFYAVRKQIADMLPSGFRVVNVTRYYHGGSPTTSTEYWYDDGHGRLYESNATILSSDNLPLYDAALRVDTSFPGSIYVWGYRYHLLPVNMFGTTLSGQDVFKSAYDFAGRYQEDWLTVPGYAFIRTSTFTYGFGSGTDSIYLVGMVKNGVVLGDTSLAALLSTFVRAPSGLTTTLTADPASAPADFRSTIVVTMHARDALGNDIKTGGATVWAGSNETQAMNVGWSSPTDFGNGTYSWVFGPSSVPGSATVYGYINGQALRQTIKITFTLAPSPEISTLTASPDSIPADGATTATITVQLYAQEGTPIPYSAGQVALHTTLGNLSAVSDNKDGTYTATLRSTTAGLAVISGTLNGEPLGNAATVTFTIIAAQLSFMLEQNFPNPFNATTTIRYAIPQPIHVTLTVFNTLGQKVAELVNGAIDAGTHKVQFNASNLTTGAYFYRMQAGSFVDTRSLLLIR